ncbi:MAG: DUF4965 domain-containing protein [Bacteroidales bacterium]|nr:DUF4965 domain-containing protein [Bacteroidales bacterium]
MIVKKTAATIFVAAVVFVCFCCKDFISKDDKGYKNELRAPAVPLISIDPYINNWSCTNAPTESTTTHWTGRKRPLFGMIRVDGAVYNFFGKMDKKIDYILPMASDAKWTSKYVFSEPKKGWTKLDFDDKTWNNGVGAYGSDSKEYGGYINTEWDTKDIWIRKKIVLEKDLSDTELYLQYSHDDIFELYINDMQVVGTGYMWRKNVRQYLNQRIKDSLKEGENIIAMHCQNEKGGSIVDVGLYEVVENDYNFDQVAVLNDVNILPTQTYYSFDCGNVQLNLVFTSPFLPDDLSLLNTPVNYITYNVKSIDGKEHDVEIYFDTDASWAQDSEKQKVKVILENKNNIHYVKAGVVNQILLDKKGDNVGIDWGYMYLGFCENSNPMSINIGESNELKYSFLKNEIVNKENEKPEYGSFKYETTPTISLTNNIGKVGRKEISNFLMLGYDNIYSFTLFKNQMMGLWRDEGRVTIYDAFDKMADNYHSIMKRCTIFDDNLIKNALNSGGKNYADLCALVYRQIIGAHCLGKTSDGELIYLSKENLSGGYIGTVDVAYPSFPLFLLYNTDLAKGMLNPIFIYAEKQSWNKPYAPHDLGIYPNADGKIYPADMPIEESGNMIIMTAAICAVDDNYNYAKKHWNMLTKWCNYLVDEGVDPSSQICTDDFMGPMAHNCNLSLKSIIGIGCYAKMAEMMGQDSVYEKYNAIAKEMAAKWEEMALYEDHYKLSFDKDKGWGLKYNLVWDEILSLGLFPSHVAEREVKYYLTKQAQYGIPLDSRTKYSKADWLVWSACLATNDEDFQKIIDGLYSYVNFSSDRLPLSDWYYSDSGNVRAFRARSVVGGFYMKMLKDKMNR